MATTLTAIEDALIAWAALITSRVVLLGNEGDRAIPRVPYLVIDLHNVNSGMPKNAFLALDGLSENIKFTIRFDAQIDLYGKNPMEDGLKLCASLQSSARYTDLYKVMGLGAAKEIRDLSFTESASRKRRAQVVIGFYAQLSYSFASDFIEKFDATIKEDTKTYSKMIELGPNPHPPC